MESLLVASSQKRYNWPVELCFYGFNALTLFDSALFYNFKAIL